MPAVGLDLGREAVARDLRASTPRDGLLDDVLEFANVAGPMMSRQQFHRLFRDLQRWSSLCLQPLGEEMLGQVRDVLPTILQGRYGEYGHVDAIVEVFP